MSLVSSFPADCRVAVVGASGGIGAAMTRLLDADERVGELYAFARTPEKIPSGRANCGNMDITDEASVAAAAEQVAEAGPLDLVLVTTGILHRGDDVRPEKALRELDPAVLAEVLAINTIGPALVAREFLPRLRRKSKSVFAALSARVGSISDNRLGGWASYRASKAALNMLLRTFAIEQRRRFPGSVVAALHPGTVATALSAPYTRRVSDSGLFEPERSARHLLEVVDRLTPEDSGGFFAWDGARIEY